MFYIQLAKKVRIEKRRGGIQAGADGRGLETASPILSAPLTGASLINI